MTDVPASSRLSTSALVAPKPRTDEKPPERIGPYRVLKRIGRGGMGDVYLGTREDEQFRRRVAIKIIRRGMDTEDILRRFEQERQVLAFLNHPNIARLLDGGETVDGRPYFVLEYVEGQPLDEYCDSRHLGIQERLDMFRKVCLAVHAAHTGNIVHRDLKPSNVIVTTDGEPKLLDFGIAKMLNPDLARVIPDPTHTELRVMTPQYASPEQVRGDPVGTTSDVYALGVMLYELMTGHRPYRLRSRVMQEIQRVICEEDPDRPSTAVEKTEEMPAIEAVGTGHLETEDPETTTTVSPVTVSRVREANPTQLRRRLRGDLDNIILMALRKEPQRRYQSAEALAGDISRHLTGEPIQARPHSAVYRASKFVRRNRIGVAVTTTVVGVAFISSIVIGQARVDAAEARESQAVAEKETAQEHMRAEVESARADQQAEVSARRADMIQRASSVFLYDFYDALPEVEGSVAVREILASSATEFLSDLQEELGDEIAASAPLKEQLADAYIRLGDIKGGLRSDNVGDTEGARDSYAKAQMLRQSMLESAPDNAEWRRDVAVSMLRTADMLRDQDPRASLEIYDAALRELNALPEGAAPDAKYERTISTVTLAAGDVHRKLGEDDAARDRYEDSMRIREELADSEGSEKARRDLAIGHGRLAIAFTEAGDLDTALEHDEANIRIRELLLAEKPDSSRLQRDLWVAGYGMAGRLLEFDPPRVDEALVHADRCTQLIESLFPTDARNARYPRELALTYELRGEIYEAAGDPEAAQREFIRFLDGVEAMLEGNALNPQYRRMAAAAHEHLGRTNSAAGDREAARREYRDALLLLDELVQENDADVMLEGARTRVREALDGLG